MSEFGIQYYDASGLVWTMLGALVLTNSTDEYHCGVLISSWHHS